MARCDRLAYARCCSRRARSMPDARADTPRHARFFDDARFAPASERIGAAQVFALSDDMRRYVDEGDRAAHEAARAASSPSSTRCTSKGDLKLEYDSAMTRNAAEAFAARSGNCLSLVIMTAAFAKALDLPVEYQKVFVDDAWARAGNMYLAIGHVNLTLGKRRTEEFTYGSRVGQEAHRKRGPHHRLPAARGHAQRAHASDHRGHRGGDVHEQPRGRGARARQDDDAYWFAREAIVQSPAFFVAYNTLAAVYHRHGDLAQAEAVLRFVVDREPANTQAMANLVRVLADAGKTEDSQRLAAALAETRARAAVRVLQPRDGRDARGRPAGRQGILRARDRALTRLSRVPLLARRRARGIGRERTARKHLASR